LGIYEGNNAAEKVCGRTKEPRDTRKVGGGMKRIEKKLLFRKW